MRANENRESGACLLELHGREERLMSKPGADLGPSALGDGIGPSLFDWEVKSDEDHENAAYSGVAHGLQGCIGRSGTSRACLGGLNVALGLGSFCMEEVRTDEDRKGAARLPELHGLQERLGPIGLVGRRG